MRRPVRKKAFGAPTIFGVLCSGAPRVPRALERRLRARARDAVLLPFQVEPRFLRNVVACMRLMDVAALAIEEAHQRAMCRHVDRLDPLAARAGAVDVIARRGKSFVGHCARAIACRELIAALTPPAKARRVALVVGEGSWRRPLEAALAEAGWTVVRSARGRAPALAAIGRTEATAKASLRRELVALRPFAALIDLGAGTGTWRLPDRVRRVNLEELTSRTYDTCVGLLTNAKFLDRCS